MLGTFKLAAIDLDDTLLAPDKSISTANNEVVNRLLNSGIKIVLASGRTLPSMLPYYRKLGLNGPLVSTNGAFVKIQISHRACFLYRCRVVCACS